MSRKALLKSIVIWERKLADPDSAEFGSEHCPLCIEYIGYECKGCPIFEKTNKRGCFGTPYITAAKLMANEEVGYGDDKEYIAAIKDEVDFLIALYKEKYKCRM